MYSERSIWRHQPRTSVPVAAAKRWATTAWRANPASNGCLKPFPAWIVVVKEPRGKRPAGWTVWPCQVSDFLSSSPACEPTYLPILAHSHVKLLVDTVGHGILQMKLAILTAQLDPKYSWHLMKTKKNAIIYKHKPSKILKGKDDFRLTFGRPMFNVNQTGPISNKPFLGCHYVRGHSMLSLIGGQLQTTVHWSTAFLTLFAHSLVKCLWYFDIFWCQHNLGSLRGSIAYLRP